MELIVDANILLAAFLKEAVTRELLLDERLHLFAPEHLLSETARHLKKDARLRRRIGISEEMLRGLFEVLTSRIQTVPAASYQSHMLKATALAAHKEDAPYLALALARNMVLWSNDRGFKQQFSSGVKS